MSVHLIHSDINPLKSETTFFDQFSKFAEDCDQMLLTAGYLSVDSIVFLQRNVDYLPPAGKPMGNKVAMSKDMR